MRDALKPDPGEADRNIMMSRRFAGGSLKVVPARAPRNLRRHTVRIVLLDELDGFETTIEGSPLKLAEQRSISYPNRKLIAGSTPTDLETSLILKRYAESDQRIFECPCTHCGEFVEIKWVHIQWPEGKPREAKFCCPACGSFSDDRDKFQMVHNGRWRVTNPEVLDHAGFRLNSLVSLLAKASWGTLAAEFVAAKENPTDLQVFVNCTLAEGWADGGAEIDEAALASRAEPFGLENIPEQVLAITGGCDVQDDRLEISLCGWGRDGTCFILAHFVLFGSPDDNSLWAEVDDLLKSRWRHPYGGLLDVEALAIDSGDGDWTQKVYDYAFPRARHRCMAIKGMCGSRPIIKASVGKMKGGGRLWIVGSDVVKTQIFSRLQRGRMIRFSNTLEAVYYEQLCSERRIVRYVRGQPVRRFERITGRVRAEALDCLTYAFAARSALPVNFDLRENALRGIVSASVSGQRKNINRGNRSGRQSPQLTM